MRYYNIMSGLRGAYCDGEGFVIAAKTRRELKEAISDCASYFKEGGYIGANKKAIANVAAMQWRDKKNYLPYVLPLAPSHNPKEYSWGVFVSPATRQDFLAYQSENR